jgi:hypothetical protein
MFGRVREVFSHPRLPFSKALMSPREARSRTHNPQFVGHLANSGFRSKSRWRQDASFRHRRVAAAVGAWLAALGIAWVVVESAMALQLF